MFKTLSFWVSNTARSRNSIYIKNEMSPGNDRRLQTAERLSRFITEKVEGLINTYCHVNGCVILESIRCC